MEDFPTLHFDPAAEETRFRWLLPLIPIVSLRWFSAEPSHPFMDRLSFATALRLDEMMDLNDNDLPELSQNLWDYLRVRRKDLESYKIATVLHHARDSIENAYEEAHAAVFEDWDKPCYISMELSGARMKNSEVLCHLSNARSNIRDEAHEILKFINAAAWHHPERMQCPTEFVDVPPSMSTDQAAMDLADRMVKKCVTHLSVLPHVSPRQQRGSTSRWVW